jgi:hypothetical protein
MPEASGADLPVRPTGIDDPSRESGNWEVVHAVLTRTVTGAVFVEVDLLLRARNL